ncbi:DDE-type integrase/transposase/recombinase [Bacillus thuringiensis]|uniref:DDE-type integrase/transposase/recombinase n=1 Tax=Bacillus thuringiensis TaxID=1428 RepID=UPI003BF6AE50
MKYVNTIIEQDHQFIKKRIRNMLRVKSLQTNTKMITGVEAMHVIKKWQLKLGEQSVQNQNICIQKIFDLTA